MALDPRNPRASFLRLLQQADLDRYEALLDLGPVQVRQRLDETNQDCGAFEILPDLAIVDRLLDEARRRRLGPVLLDHLPEEEGLWRGARATVPRMEPKDIGAELPGDDDFGPWRSVDELPGEEDFRPWGGSDDDTDKD